MRIYKILLFKLLMALTLSGPSYAYQNGDVILISMDCTLCRMIEQEDGGKYSHAGVIVEEKGEIYVLQSLSRVEKLSLGEFLRLARKGSEVRLMRPIEFEKHSPSSQEFLILFKSLFEHLSYDRDFNWGDEKLYCSEFIVKFLNYFLEIKIKPNSMTFHYNLDLWNRYFKGEVPHGKPGFSPNDFLYQNEFTSVQGN